MVKYGLSENLIETLKSIFSENSLIEKVILYGSRAKGNFKTGSDIDLCLVGEQLNLKSILKLEAEIESINTPYSFDICIYHQIDNLSFKEHIDRVGIPIFHQHP